MVFPLKNLKTFVFGILGCVRSKYYKLQVAFMSRSGLQRD